MRTSTGTDAGVLEIRCYRAQVGAAKRNDEGMALKILTRAEDIPDRKKIL
jgi:hypothetical protein